MSGPATDADALDSFTYDELLTRRQARSMRALPGLLRSSVRLILRSAKREFVAVTVLQVIAALLAAAQLLAMRQLLTRVVALGKSTTAGDVLPWGAIVVGIVTVSGIVGLARGEIGRVLTDLVAREAQEEVAKAASTADLIDFDRSAFHNRLERVLANSSFRPMQLTGAVVGMVGAAVAILAVVVTLGAIQPVLVLVALVGAVPLLIATRATTRLNVDFEVEQTEVSRQRQYLLYLLSQKDSAKEIRGYNLAEFLTRRHSALWSARIARLRAVARRRFGLGSVARVLSGLVMGGVLLVLVRLLDRGTISLAEAAVAAGAVVLLAQRAQALVGGFGMMFECTTFLHEVDRFLGDASSKRAEMAARPTFELAVGAPLSVVASDVGFEYPNASSPALSDVSVSVRTGEVVALVGPNGSGKTTLAKILGGLYEPSAGVVAWNGVAVAGLDEVSVREHVAFVFQDFVRFFFSAGENIGFGRWQRASDRDGIASSAGAAGAAGFLERLPAGYDTLLAPQFTGGRDLSVGQWQRVAVARAFFRDGALVVLDEPSSALDPEAEAALFDSLRGLCAGKAVIVISHRFSTVSGADRIYVLDGGRVVEGGSHRELLDLDGTYARLFRLQAAAYIEG